MARFRLRAGAGSVHLSPDSLAIHAPTVPSPRHLYGRRTRFAGIVITRQRPGSAKNVVFLTLEDEAGHVNTVVWKQLAERQRRELVHARLLGVSGEVQREGEVLHLIAHRLEDHTALLGELATRSRDFK